MRQTLRRSALLSLAVAALGFAMTASDAADLAEAPGEPLIVAEADDDLFALSTYFWATIYSGDMTINGQMVRMSGKTVFDLLDAGDLRFPPLVAKFDWERGNWGALFDITAIGLNFSGNDISFGPGPLTAAFGLDFTYVLINTGVTYRVSEWQSANGFTHEFHVLGGARYTYYDVDLNGSIGPVPVTFSDTLDWVDGIVGARLRGMNADGITYALYGDIGVGAGFSLQALATIGKTWRYEIFDLNLFGGYRVLYQDWSQGDDAVDLMTHGPLLGLKLTF